MCVVATVRARGRIPGIIGIVLGLLSAGCTLIVGIVVLVVRLL